MRGWVGVLAAVAVLGAACTGGRGESSISMVDDSGTPDAPTAPDFPGGHTWFNVATPLTMEDLRGKVVLLDFWTAGCINCQQIIPDEKRLQEEFGDALVVVGVHSGKYDREHEDDSVEEAVRRFGLEHPVVNDPDFIIWSAYGVRAWPTLVLIDPAGQVVGARSGEGVYDAFQPAIFSLIEEFDAKGKISREPIATEVGAGATTSAILQYPSAVLGDAEGERLFIADAGRNRVLIAGLDGELTAAIGSGRAGFDDGSFEEASFSQPQGLALSPDGATLYVADTRNHAVRAVDLESRVVQTVAGTGERAYAPPRAGAPAVDTALASPWGLVLHDGALFIAMAGTHQIWTLDLETDAVSVFAGSGAEGIDDGPRLQATLAQPSGLTTGGGHLYWVDPESSSVRRVRLDGEGPVETLVGTGLFDFGDADGAGSEALLEHPQGIVFANGLLYVADTYNHKLRSVDPASAAVSTVAGGGEAGFRDGLGTEALLSEPGGLGSANGVLYVADTNNHVVRVMELGTGTGTVTTLQLMNLAAVAASTQGVPITVSLPGQTVTLETSSLRIRLATPEGFHLNSLAPSELVLSSSNAPALAVEEDVAAWSTDESSVEVSVRVTVGRGDAILSARGPVYYCRDGDEAICLVADVDIALPLSVSETASNDEIVLDYVLSDLS